MISAEKLSKLQSNWFFLRIKKKKELYVILFFLLNIFYEFFVVYRLIYTIANGNSLEKVEQIYKKSLEKVELLSCEYLSIAFEGSLEVYN